MVLTTRVDFRDLLPSFNAHKDHSVFPRWQEWRVDEYELQPVLLKLRLKAPDVPVHLVWVLTKVRLHGERGTVERVGACARDEAAVGGSPLCVSWLIRVDEPRTRPGM